MFEITKRVSEIKRDHVRLYTTNYAQLTQSVITSMDVYYNKYRDNTMHTRQNAALKIKSIAEHLAQIDPELLPDIRKKALLLQLMYNEMDKIVCENGKGSNLYDLLYTTLYCVCVKNDSPGDITVNYSHYLLNAPLGEQTPPSLINTLRFANEDNLSQTEEILLDIVLDQYKPHWKAEIQRFCSLNNNALLTEANQLIDYLNPDAADFSPTDFFTILRGLQTRSNSRVEKQWNRVLLGIENDLIQLNHLSNVNSGALESVHRFSVFNYPLRTAMRRELLALTRHSAHSNSLSAQNHRLLAPRVNLTLLPGKNAATLADIADCPSDEIPCGFQDSVSLAIMDDPVIVNEQGETLDRSSYNLLALQYGAKEIPSPETRAPLWHPPSSTREGSRAVIPNIPVRQLIDDFMQQSKKIPFKYTVNRALFLDPITEEIMTDPVVVNQQGDVMDRVSYDTLKDEGRLIHPDSKNPMWDGVETTVIPNLLLRKLIDEFGLVPAPAHCAP